MNLDLPRLDWISSLTERLGDKDLAFLNIVRKTKSQFIPSYLLDIAFFPLVLFYFIIFFLLFWIRFE